MSAVAVIVVLSIFFHYVPFVLWLSAKVSGVQISLLQLFLMRIRNVPPHAIVQAMIEAHKAGLNDITRDGLEAHYLAGGHVAKVVHALVSASKANIELTFQMKIPAFQTNSPLSINVCAISRFGFSVKHLTRLIKALLDFWM